MINSDSTYKSFFMVSFLLILVFGFDKYLDLTMFIGEVSHLLYIKILSHNWQPHERRKMISVGRIITSSDGWFSKRPNNRSVAIRPTDSVGARTVVRGGLRKDAKPRSSKPITAISSGTLHPYSCKALRTPMAASSSPANIASNATRLPLLRKSCNT